MKCKFCKEYAVNVYNTRGSIEGLMFTREEFHCYSCKNTWHDNWKGTDKKGRLYVVYSLKQIQKMPLGTCFMHPYHGKIILKKNYDENLYVRFKDPKLKDLNLNQGNWDIFLSIPMSVLT